MGARERSEGARARKRTRGRRRVVVALLHAVVSAVVRHADINLESGATCTRGDGELGAHERSQVGQGERQGAAIPLLEGRTSEKRFRTRRRLQTETSQEGELPGTPTLP